ncbi:MAG TPA: hypothetical protein VIB99_10130, partial [Candidatus Limnocylindrales bacterium]
MSDAAILERRLDRFRTARDAERDRVTGGLRDPAELARSELARSELARSADARAQLLAQALGGRRVDGPGGGHVLIEPQPVPLPIDRDRSASLPGLPGPEVTLVCLDTETTGLATGAGTLAFLVGLGWW